MSSALPTLTLKSLSSTTNPNLSRVYRGVFDGKRWRIATNGNAAALVEPLAKEKLPLFSGNLARAFGEGRVPPFSIAWHDLQSWLRECPEHEQCPRCGGVGSYGPEPCDFCDGIGRLDRKDGTQVLGCPVDRELVAKYLAPFYSPRVRIDPGSPKAESATLFAAQDDRWRVYVMPLRWLDGVVPWLPHGWLEAA